MLLHNRKYACDFSRLTFFFLLLFLIESQPVLKCRPLWYAIALSRRRSRTQAICGNLYEIIGCVCMFAALGCYVAAAIAAADHEPTSLHTKKKKKRKNDFDLRFADTHCTLIQYRRTQLRGYACVRAEHAEHSASECSCCAAT